MKISMLYFSPTGGTKKAAELLAHGLGGEIQPIDLSHPAKEPAALSKELCLIAVPSFGGRVPAIALERLSKFAGQGVPAVLLVSFGNRAYDDTLLELQEAAVAAGFCPIAAVAAVTEHSIMHQFGAGRPNSEDEAELGGFGGRIAALLAAKNCSGALPLPGNHPFRDYNGVPFKPKAGKQCTKCGLCAAECPVGAIPKDEPNTTDADCCISCMRCISVCPQKARGLSKVMLAVTGEKMKKACSQPKKNEIFLAGIDR